MLRTRLHARLMKSFPFDLKGLVSPQVSSKVASKPNARRKRSTAKVDLLAMTGPQQPVKVVMVLDAESE